MKKMSPFIVIEGIDGCGKTSVVKSIGEKYPFFHLTREPGGSLLSESIRNFILSEKGAILSPEEQMTMFFAGRQIHLLNVINKKREEGVPVLCDRFDASTFAFQKCVSLDKEDRTVINVAAFKKFFELRDHVVSSFPPSLYIYLKADEEVAMNRRHGDAKGGMNHFDLASLSEQKRRSKAYELFFDIISKKGERFVTVNANKTLEEVWGMVEIIVQDELKQSK